jgi:SH3 domain protein
MYYTALGHGRVPPPKSTMKQIALALCLLLLALPASALYVTDEFQITLRSGPSTKNQVLKMLDSGTSLQPLGDESDGWIKVRMGTGTEGWVLKRYMIQEPIHRVRLERAQRQLESLREKTGELERTLQSVSSERGDLGSQVQQLTAQNNKLTKELDDLKKVAARPVAIEQQNQELSKRVGMLDEEKRLLKTENERLQDRSQRDWFVTGAGVLLAGIVLGLILPRLRRKRDMWREF